MILKRWLFLTFVLLLTASCSALESVFRPPTFEGEPIYVGSSPCALPCFYGITPGETPDQRALEYIESLPLDQRITDYPSRFWITGWQGSHVEVDIKYTYGPYFDVVDGIELNTYDNGSSILTLGQFITAGWTPRRVYRIRASLAAVLLLVFGEYDQIGIIVADYPAIDSESPIISIFLAPEYSSFWGFMPSGWHFDDEIPWLGYASADDYWAAIPINNRSLQ